MIVDKGDTVTLVCYGAIPWLTALEAKKKSEENTSKGDTPEGKWYGEWWGIMLIIVAVLAVIGGIAWLIKANSSEEGEGESE